MAWRGRAALYTTGLLAAVALGWAARSVADVRRADSAAAHALPARLVDAHVRALMGDHLLDVRSSDRHTVKPWFIGKTDFAPRVVELTGVGFPLLGGRTEYLGGHVAAALVYGRRQHVINLFVWPVSPGEAASSNAPLATNTGYTLVHWIASGMSYRAVSDASPAELDAFRQAFLSAP